MKIHLLIICLIFCSLTSLAQIAPPNHSFMVKPIFGTHAYSDQGHLFQDKIYGLDVAYLKEFGQTDTKWINIAKARSFGLGILYRDLNNLKGISDTSANSFGQLYGLNAQIDFQLLRIGKARLIFTPSVGLAYASKNFFTNNKNRFLGSHLNETIKADIGIELPISKHTDFLFGVGTLHVSNGGAVIPNGGLNTVHIYAGLKLNNTQEQPKQEEQTNTTLHRSSIELSFGLGKRGVFEEKNKKLYKSGLYAGYNYYLNDVFSLKAGIDAVYYYDIYDSNNHVKTFQYYATSYDRWRLGASAGVDANVWRLTFTAQLGKYIHYNSLYKNATWYWAFGPTINITPHIGVQAKTYMHFFQADYINYGLVFRL